MHAVRLCGRHVFAALAALASVGTAHAGVTVLYAFHGRDGNGPNGLIEDSAGNLYGTTFIGGSGGARCNDEGCGTVFKLAPDGTETVLYKFTATGDGAYPEAGVILDRAGNLYGTTVGSGSSAGNVFKLAPDGTETVLHAFHGSDGAYPMGAVIRDRAGNLYGTTAGGGDRDCDRGQGCGTVFELAPDGSETVLYSFTGGNDGADPEAALIRDKAGNLYGTTSDGGAGAGGTVFKLAPDGTETVLCAFTRENGDGYTPGAGLTEDKTGNLYGTTESGGAYDHGTVFKLAPDGTETVLYSFTGGRDGSWPLAGLIEDRAGNLYGTTAIGGDLHCALDSFGCGTVFKLAPDGTETVLHAFRGRKDGFLPDAGLIFDGTGHLYGTATGGGHTRCGDGCGTVFRLKK